MLSKLSRRQFAASLAVIGSLAFLAPAQAAEPENTMIITLKDGDVTIALRPDLAPKHVSRIKELVREGAYDNVAFHRVIDGFMAQTGDVQFGKSDAPGFNLAQAGMGGSDLPDVEAEFNTESFQRGVLGAARSQDPNSFNSQFFITTADASFLDGQYTVFGKVVSGMEFVDALEKGPQELNGAVANPDKIVTATIEYK